MARLIIALIAAAFGLLVIEESNVAWMISPMLAVVLAVSTSEELLVPVAS